MGLLHVVCVPGRLPLWLCFLSIPFVSLPSSGSSPIVSRQSLLLACNSAMNTNQNCPEKYVCARHWYWLHPPFHLHFLNFLLLPFFCSSLDYSDFRNKSAWNSPTIPPKTQIFSDKCFIYFYQLLTFFFQIK